MTPPDGAQARKGWAGSLRAGLILLVALALIAATILLGPTIAEKAIVAIAGNEASAPVAEAIFNAIVFGTLLVLGVVGAFVSRVNPFAAGRRPLAMLGLGLFVGLFGVTVTTGYSGIVGALSVGAPGYGGVSMLAFGAAVVFLQASAEEVYFRGWVQPALAKAWGPAAAVILAAAAFSVLHILGGARAPLTLINLFLGGILFGLLAAYGRGLLGAVAAHFAWNGAEQLILGLDPNPGVSTFGSVFNFELIGAQSWGGSEEGLNASFAMTLTLFAVVIPLALLVKNRLGDRST